MHSSTWWEKTLAQVSKHYEQWRVSTPLERVQLQAELPEELRREPYLRTEHRGVGALLRAVPEDVKQVL